MNVSLSVVGGLDLAGQGEVGGPAGQGEATGQGSAAGLRIRVEKKSDPDPTF